LHYECRILLPINKNSFTKRGGGMEKKDKNREQEVLLCVTNLPEQIVKLHGQENMLELLLHAMSQKNCFNFSKAAYFIDNPEFDHLKGVAGVHEPEAYDKDHWKDPQEFSDHMNRAPFNNQVRQMMLKSIKKNSHSEKEVVSELSKELAFKNFHYLSWPVKYNNHGLLIFETEQDEHDQLKEHLESGVHLFGFCPVF
jgi:hypothetical protein